MCILIGPLLFRIATTFNPPSTYPAPIIWKSSQQCSIREPFHLSSNQMYKAEKYTLAGPFLDVYVVFRVYDLDFENTLTAKLMTYVDPWRMMFDGTLHWRTLSDFHLTPSSNA